MIYIITEMALERKIVISKIRDIQDILLDHVFKYAIFDSEETRNHWETEIWGFLYKIQRLKIKTNKHLSAKLYFDLLYNELTSDDFQTISNDYRFWVNNPKYKKLNKKYYIDLNEFMTKIKNFFKEVSTLISLNELDELNLHELLEKL